MYLTLCVTAVLLHGVSCHLFPAVLDSATKMDHFTNFNKRQSLAQLQQCISAGVNAAFPGNTASSFVSNCRLAALEQITITGVPPQSQIDRIFSSFCIPECGNVIQDVYDDCGYFDVTIRGNEQFLAGLCGTNENGVACYRIYSAGIDQVESERDCFVANRASGQCTCRSLLLSDVSNQGCCFDVYHDLLSLQTDTYSPRELYNDCNVDRPADCNNTPIGNVDRPTNTNGNSIGGSISLVSSVTLITGMVCFAALG